MLPTRVILPRQTPGLRQALRDLWLRRELLAAWTVREIKVRYKQSLLGVAWAIMQPLSLMLIFTVVFTRFLQAPTGDLPYPLFAYTALLPWTFFATAVSQSAVSVLSNMSLVSKVHFPREILPLAQIGAAGFDFLVAALLFVGLLAWYRIPLRLTWLAAPLLLLIQIVLTIGLSLLLSALIVRFRDLRFVVPLGLQLWLYATPIIYPATVIPANWRWLLRLNPMAALIDGYRRTFLHGQWPDWGGLAGASVLALALGLIGFWVFKRTELWFADIL